tara:strand:+ start:189 stop:482 length:294 start_codon:yes stop_codon:yes gene_type:complete
MHQGYKSIAVVLVVLLIVGTGASVVAAKRCAFTEASNTTRLYGPSNSRIYPYSLEREERPEPQRVIASHANETTEIVAVTTGRENDINGGEESEYAV